MIKQYTIKSQPINYRHLFTLAIGLCGFYVYSIHGNMGILIASAVFTLFGISDTVVTLQINEENISYTKAKLFGLIVYNRTRIKTNEIGLVKFSEHKVSDIIDIWVNEKKHTIWATFFDSQLLKIIEALKEVNPEITIVK